MIFRDFKVVPDDKVKGYFSIQLLRGDKVVDEFEDKNLIMDRARLNMAKLIGGVGTAEPITKLVMGTQGHNQVTGDIFSPVDVGTNGYTPDRELLFSQESQQFYYTLDFGIKNPMSYDNDTPLAWNQVGNTFSLDRLKVLGNRKNERQNTANAENCICLGNILISGNTLSYEVEIPEGGANGLTVNSVTPYTEFALFTGSDIFSMKTTPAKAKSIQERMKILWRIYF